MADEDKNFFNKIIMGHETWCFASDPETKRQSSEWVGETSPWLKEQKFQKSCFKIMLILFLNSQGIVHKTVVPGGKAVNAEFYKSNGSPPEAHSVGSSSCILLSRFLLVAQ
jgi:hypothetical protein